MVKPGSKRQASIVGFGQDYSKDIGVELFIPGTWWRGGTAAQRNKFWKAVVVEDEKNHQFPSGQKKEGVLLSCPEYDVSNDSEREFWCEIRGRKGYVD